MKKHLLIFLILFTVNCLKAFAQEIDWQNTIGGTDVDELYAMQQTSDGGFIVCGSSISSISGDKTESNCGVSGFSPDFWVIKTDVNGNIQWQNTIGGTNIDKCNSIKQTSDGGYILGGLSRSDISCDKTENCYDSQGSLSYDYWIIKIDSVGIILFENTIGGTFNDELYSIQQTFDQGYILAGKSASNISGDKTENSIGGLDYWIVKTDSNGSIIWQKTIGGSNNDELTSIQQTTDGGYILGGTSFSGVSGDKTTSLFGLNDFWIVKIDLMGNIQWQKSYGGIGYDYLKSIQQTIDGGFVIGGYSNSNISGNKSENCLGGNDYWIVKTDSQGIIQWQNTIGGGFNDYLYSIEQTADGGYIMGGNSNSNLSGDKTQNSKGDYDFWVIKTDVSGLIQWQKTIGGSNSDLLYSVTQTDDGDYCMGGSSMSNISGDKLENCIGGYDYWIVKLTESFNFINGKVYADFNMNSIQDSGEPSLQNTKITEQSTGRFAFSQINGSYSLLVLDSGNYNIGTGNFYDYTSVPLTHQAYFSDIFLTDSLNDFGFQPQVLATDFCVSITPLSMFRSGLNASYMINYGNYGSITSSPILLFFPDNNVTYFSSSLTPFSVTIDSVKWNLPALAPFQTGSFIVTVTVDAGLPIGTLINSSVRIDPIVGDLNPTCNYGAWEAFITGSYDPNDILVNEDTLTTTQLATEPFLEYIIRFQNTGNDTAFTVKILNLIDTLKLNLSSFEFVNASHNVELKWLPWERNMEFKFNNILLPDSNINEPLSHGFVRYRIQPKTSLVAGDSVANNAAIYFDFNAPVLTNTAITKIVLPTGLQAPETKYDYIIYPNPTTGQVLLELNATYPTNAQVSLHTIQGKMIKSESYTLKVGTNKLNLNTSELSSGIYLVRMAIDGNSVVKKLVKM